MTSRRLPKEVVMTCRIAQWTIDAVNVEATARFWAAALDLELDAGSDGSARLYPRNGERSLTPTIWVQRVDERKSGKNRAHPDLVAEHGMSDLEVDRLIALGARLADVGQKGTEPFVVLADPDGNEFCVLEHHPRRPPRNERSSGAMSSAR
jgi:catechol 2,3-dioxygenase-like lactoylglutathione lyase family enzyme